MFTYSRDELTTEDVLILDCHTEIYVWVSHNSVVKSKQQALSIGLAFLEKDVLGECLSVETPIHVVTKGHEPPFFTRFFDWDASKANATRRPSRGVITKIPKHVALVFGRRTLSRHHKFLKSGVSCFTR
ncbi:putative villin/Gelsolin, ADF-H/Gelsolin-like domain superfamily [Helianthus debilis subsp. tardiflorus]